MSFILFVGLFMSCLGPSLSLFLSSVIGKADVFVVCLVSMATYLFSLLIPSFSYLAVRHHVHLALLTSTLMVISQELFRVVFYYFVRYMDNMTLKYLRRNVDAPTPVYAYAGGLGFGLMNAILYSSNVIASVFGPGDMNTKSYYPQIYFYLVLRVNLMLVFHVAASILLFAFMNRERKAGIVVVTGIHLVLSLSSGLNNLGYGGVTAVIQCIICALTCLSAYVIAGGRTPFLRNQFTWI